MINKGEVKRFGFKNCTSIDQLYEALKAFPLWTRRFINKKCHDWEVRYRESAKRAGEEVDEAAMNREFDEIEASGGFSLGPLDPDNFFFYLVLDNVKSLFKIERQKKVIEKLAICQTHLNPTCFSIVVINDALVQEIQVFKEQTNVFDEYMFSSFYFSPLTRQHLYNIMKLTLTEMRITDQQTQESEIDEKYLTTVFPDFFSMIYNQLSQYSVSIKEYAYMCLFLYPHYMEKVYIENRKIKELELQRKQLGSQEQDKLTAAKLQTGIERLIDRRGAELGNKAYRGLLQEMLNNLYQH